MAVSRVGRMRGTRVSEQAWNACSRDGGCVLYCQTLVPQNTSCTHLAEGLLHLGDVHPAHGREQEGLGRAGSRCATLPWRRKYSHLAACFCPKWKLFGREESRKAGNLFRRSECPVGRESAN
eukprot:1157546-Pelagomonas_calceolata.AAC.3